MNAEPSRPDQAHPLHYQVLCGLALSAIFLVQFEQGNLLGNVLIVGVGGVGILARLRAGPFLFLVVFALSQAGHHLGLRRLLQTDLLVQDAWDPTPLVLAAAVLTYIIGQYRLQAIWHNILPIDPRRRAGPPQRRFPWFRALPPVVPQPRSTESLTRREIGLLLLGLPLWVGLAQAAWLVLSLTPAEFGIPSRLWQAFLLVWTLVIGAFVTRLLWLRGQRRDMDVVQAQMLLQDVLWKELRREQRSAHRWLAWWKLRQRDSQQGE